jgi:hypothetical protein
VNSSAFWRLDVGQSKKISVVDGCFYRCRRIYDRAGITYLFDLDFFHLKKEAENSTGTAGADATTGTHLSPKRSDMKDRRRNTDWYVKYTVDA